jgi:hypothetical protein
MQTLQNGYSAAYRSVKLTRDADARRQAEEEHISPSDRTPETATVLCGSQSGPFAQKRKSA